MKNVDFATYELLDAAKRVLIENGWVAKEQNDLERAIVGFAMCDPEIEEVRWLRWMPFGRELEPQIIICDSGPEFIDILRSLVLKPWSSNLFESCDDMAHEMCGFAWYGKHKAGIAEIYRISINRLLTGDCLHDLRNILMQVEHLERSERKAQA